MKKETYKIAFNDNHAGFILSNKGMAWMKEHGYAGKFFSPGGEFIVPRHHPLLVACIEALGEEACGELKMHGRSLDTSALRIAETDSPLYYIENYDGRETVISSRDLTDATPRRDGLFTESFPEERVYFTADTHFGNNSIIKYSGRPFKDAQEMDEEFIRRWNETVPEDGIVFHLGDFAHGPASRWSEILHRLNGQVHLVVGNHDSATAKRGCLENFATVREQRIIEVGGQKILLNHYPFLCYGGAYDGIWQLFGHVHSGPLSLSGLDLPRLRMLFPCQYDVGVDGNGFRPVSFGEVREKIRSQVAAAAGRRTDMREEDLSSGRPVVFLDVDGVLVRSSATREPDTAASEHLKALLRESGAALVVTGGWAAFGADALAAGPLRAFASDLAGVTPRAASCREAVAAWLQSSGGKHRYTILSTAPSDDTRSVLVNPTAGLTGEDVTRALDILK